MKTMPALSNRSAGAVLALFVVLALAPLDFTALMLRASLLDRLGDPKSGEAWGHAIAQKPAETLPPSLGVPFSFMGCMQDGPLAVASRSPSQGTTGLGAAQRKAPTGGAA